MAVNRQLNLLGQQRIDVPHIRSLESAVCYDFDAVALMVTGGLPCVVNGFDVGNYNTVVGTLATNLIINTANSRIIHPLASDSGSFFQVPANRAAETITTNNPRIKGAWAAGTVNYVGVDLLRTADATTATTVRFVTTNPDTETSKYVPLARTMDYVITISTVPFSVTPSICPLLIVTTDTTNTITAITDARNLLFSNFSGGDSPSLNNPFGWPGGRGNPTGFTALTAGDKSIKSLNQFVSAVSTRFQELGGGEFWYSLTADRNVRMTQGGPFFTSDGESFEWDGTNLHWKSIKFVFDNSTSWLNEVADQTVDSAGLTDLAEGECIYVDLDRSSNHTVAGSNSLVAQKAILATLGGSAVPGQRWVIANRLNNQIFVKDQSYPVGSAFSLATISQAGVIRTTINANGTISDPVAVGLADSISGNYTATCGGVSHNNDLGISTLLSAADIIIGRGNSAGDQNVIIKTDTSGTGTTINGQGDINHPYLTVKKGTGFNTTNSTILSLDGVCNLEGTRAWSLNTISVMPLAPVLGDAIGSTVKYFCKQTKTWKQDVKYVATTLDGSWSYNSSVGILTHSVYVNYAPDGTGVIFGDRVLIDAPGSYWNGIYTVIAPGDGSSYTLLQRTVDAGGPASATLLGWGYDLFDGSAVYVQSGSSYSGKSFVLIAEQKAGSVVLDGTQINTWGLTDGVTADQWCVMWSSGDYTVIATGPDYTVSLS